jgi:hypothetical protein
MYHLLSQSVTRIFSTECIYRFCMISEEPKIISLNSINLLIFIMETLRVRFQVRTDFLNII